MDRYIKNIPGVGGGSGAPAATGVFTAFTAANLAPVFAAVAVVLFFLVDLRYALMLGIFVICEKHSH